MQPNYSILLWALALLTAFFVFSANTKSYNRAVFCTAAIRRYDVVKSAHSLRIVKREHALLHRAWVALSREGNARPAQRLGFQRPVGKVNWDNKRFTSHGTLIPASKRHEEHRTKSAYRRWFLDIFSPAGWSLDVLKYQDVELKDIADHLREAGYSFIHDDSVTVIKTLVALPITIAQTIGKTDKRLSRLVGETMFRRCECSNRRHGQVAKFVRCR